MALAIGDEAQHHAATAAHGDLEHERVLALGPPALMAGNPPRNCSASGADRREV